MPEFRRWSRWIARLLLCAVAGWANPLAGQTDAFARRVAVTPWQDDAQIHDLHLVGNDLAWAVGDHGVVWHSTDGGKSWNLQPSGVSAALHSVWFLNRKEGWIVG
jgi:photosystem II stability/assembly factor-like uncharacterized protein